MFQQIFRNIIYFVSSHLSKNSDDTHRKASTIWFVRLDSRKAFPDFSKGMSIKYVRSEGRGVVELKSYWLILGEVGGQLKAFVEHDFFLAILLQNISKLNKVNYSDR